MRYFRSEYELQQVMQRCHDILWERHGLDPAQAFDELSKLLFVKLYDETTSGIPKHTLIRRGESPHDFAKRVRLLFERACNASRFNGIFTEQMQSLLVDDLTIYEVFQHLQSYSLTGTATLVHGADIKGTAYETIISNIFRGKLGQFFTHRNIVEFMVRMIGIDEHRVVYDPACGSGGFLVMCARILRENILMSEPNISPAELDRRLYRYSQQCLFGTDINERAARVAKLNLLLHGLDYTNIFCANALKLDDCPELLHRFREGSIDVVFANPPFAGYEKNPTILRQFELGRNGHGQPVAVTREVLFIELIIRLLREGGLAGIVVPQGILTNRSLQRVREFIMRNTQILAIIELPDWAFIPSGTSVRGSLLFLRKTVQPPIDYLVFMKRVEHIGFTSTGRPSGRNDFPETIQEFHRQDTRFLVPVQELNGRLDAQFHIPEHRPVIRLFTHNPKHPLIPLEQLGTFDTETYNPKRYPDKEIMLIETSSVDPVTLTVAPKRVLGRDCHYTHLKVVRSGDILISRRRAYRGAVVEIPPELDGAMAIPEFSVLRLHSGINRNYVLEVLRSKPFLDLMTIYSTGEMSGRISETDLRRLKIPVPDYHHALGAIFVTHRQRIAQLEDEIAKEKEHIATLVMDILEGRDVSPRMPAAKERLLISESRPRYKARSETPATASSRGRQGRAKRS